MKSYLFVVEGSQDIALIGKILKEYYKYIEIKEITKLSDFARNLLPVDFPFKDNSIDIFNVVPTFFHSKEKDIEICCVLGHGEDNILKTLNDILVESERSVLVNLTGITVFADADTYTKNDKINYLKNSIANVELDYINLTCFNNGIIQIRQPKININISIFIFPNNCDLGKIEDIVIENLEASEKYKNLLKQATSFIDNAKTWSSENSKREKAIIGSLGNIYNSGSSNVVHIGSDKVKWLDKNNLIGGLQEIIEFLDNELN